MDVELRHLRCFLAVIDEGSFTDAAAQLGVSQAAVSRNLAAFEQALGVRVLRRTSRSVTLTGAGARVLPHARRVAAEADILLAEARSGRTSLRLGYAWSAIGRHTTALQRRWPAQHPDTTLELVRTNSASAGLFEGRCDVAILRTDLTDRRLVTEVVGLERRRVAFAADDAWARRRSLSLAEVAQRTILIDRRTGTTTPQLWPEGTGPARVRYVAEVDDWLTIIAAGEGVGISSEATEAQYPRPGIVYRPLRDAPPIVVRLAWWRDDPHPATAALLAAVTDLYGAR
jgi:DNA-binding transcriptional LysR family regulator